MKKEKLAEAIREAFKNETYVGDDVLVYDNSEDHIECANLKKSFVGRTWREVGHEMIFENRDALPFFSPQGFKSYLPAFMLDVLADFYAADTLSDNLLGILTLPGEADVATMTNNIEKYQLDEKLPDFNFEEFLDRQSETTGERVSRFLECADLLNIEQKKVTAAFLQYLGDHYPAEYADNPVNSKTALGRFWFQFQ